MALLWGQSPLIKLKRTADHRGQKSTVSNKKNDTDNGKAERNVGAKGPSVSCESKCHFLGLRDMLGRGWEPERKRKIQRDRRGDIEALYISSWKRETARAESKVSAQGTCGRTNRVSGRVLEWTKKRLENSRSGVRGENRKGLTVQGSVSSGNEWVNLTKGQLNKGRKRAVAKPHHTIETARRVWIPFSRGRKTPKNVGKRTV